MFHSTAGSGLRQEKTGNLKEGKIEAVRRRTWKHGIYTAMNERGLRMGERNNRSQWNMEVGRRRQAF